jgi:small subunit ribosomal protein S4
MQEELKLIGQYGLRNKHELWRHETMLSKFRATARSLIGQTPEERKKMEDELLVRLKRLGILHETAVLDDVLDLTIEDLLERRFQTVVLRRSLAKTIQQARQLITHGHITIGSQRVRIPGYIVTKSDEGQIQYVAQSSLANVNHPLRQTITVAPSVQVGPEKTGEEES